MEKESENEKGIGSVGGGAIGLLAGGGIGYWFGYNRGKTDGYQDGFSDGERTGYQCGYNQGIADATKDSQERIHSLVNIEIAKFEIENNQTVPRVNFKSNMVPKQVQDAFIEACNCYVYPQKRAGCIMCGVSIELALKKKYRLLEGKEPDNNLNFHSLINWASNKGLIDKQNNSVAHTIRILENLYKHDYRDVDNLDQINMLSGSLRFINSMF